MKEHKIIWTACPNGVRDGQLQLSVHVSHRLGREQGDPSTGSLTLGDYPDALSWPDHDVIFTVNFATPGSPAVTVAASLTPPSPEPQLWSALFDATTPVTPFLFQDYRDTVPKTYHMDSTHRFVRGYIGDIALNSPSAPPPPALFKAGLGQLAIVARGSTDTALRGQVHALRRARFSARAVQAAGPVAQFQAASDYYQPYTAAYTDQPVDPRDLVIPPMDIHGLLGSLGQYPALLRRAGLVFDLTIPLPDDLPAAGLVYVTASYTPLGDAGSAPIIVNVTPRTMYTLSGTLFQATARQVDPRDDAPFTSDLVDGWLALGDGDKFQAYEVDVDAAALKVPAYAAAVQTAQAAAVAWAITLAQATGDNVALAAAQAAQTNGADDTHTPALRSGGISIARSNRFDAAVDPDLTAAGNNNDKVVLGGSNGADIALSAEDITRGYRVDVYQQTPDGARAAWFPLCAREGVYTFTATGRTERFADEGWIGLSATKPPPSVADPAPSATPPLGVHEALFRWTGWSLVASRPNAPPDDGAPAKPVRDDLRLRTTFVPQKGSLPSLRFGDHYRLRARAVDLAGNSLPFTAEGSGVDKTEIALDDTYTRFEPVSSPALVKTAVSVLGESSARLVLRSNVGVAASAYVAPGETAPRPDAQRHLIPPATSESAAETHGQFDGAAGRLRRAAYTTIVAHEGVVPALVPGTTVALPYLPDPFARGVTVQGLAANGAGATMVTLRFEGTWPDLRTLRLVVEELLPGQEPWVADQRAGTLTVRLAKAEQRTILLSSVLDAADVDRMGIWKWTERRLQAETQGQDDQDAQQGDLVELRGLRPKKPPRAVKQLRQQVRQLAEDGAHLMMTPTREVTLVHAVQQPLVEWDKDPDPKAAKVLDGMLLARQDLTNLYINHRIPLDGASTMKFELLARWEEHVDDLALPDYDPTPRPTRTRAFEQAVPVTAPTQVTAPNFTLHGIHHFGDTKYRRVSYHGVATTRFAEYFTDHPADAGIALTQQTAEVAVDVLSAALPAALKIASIVPTFGWDRQTGSRNGRATITSTRRGNGLRVYLERPWYSSGEGEVLGVVFNPSAGSSDPADIQAITTRFAADPAYARTSSVHPAVKTEHFANPSVASEGLPAAQQPDAHGGFLHAVGYAPAYDKTRRLWYADIEIDAGPTYFPFVRLALARYQPHSLSGLHLGPIVIADIAQLTAGRVATIIPDPLDPTKLTVSVSGLDGGAFGPDQTIDDLIAELPDPSLILTPPRGKKKPPTPAELLAQLEAQLPPPRFQVTLETKGTSSGGNGVGAWVPVLHEVTHSVTSGNGRTRTYTTQDPLEWGLVIAVQGDGSMVASAAVELPRPRGSVPYRLVITEGEIQPVDNTSSGYATRASYPYRRVVYVDAIELT